MLWTAFLHLFLTGAKFLSQESLLSPLHNWEFLKSTTPVQALKHCEGLLRRSLTALDFFARSAPSKAGYGSFLVLASTHSHTGSVVPLSHCFDIVSCTHFPGSLHSSLLLFHSPSRSLLIHNIPTTRIFLPIISSLLPGIS